MTPSGASGKGPRSASLVIGLVNNMSPGAIRSTERQFAGHLAAASAGCSVELRYFSLTRPVTTDAAHVPAYGDLGTLRSSKLDGLVVTGSRPTTADLRDEPVWPLLTAVLDLARERAIPAVLSCLSAHATVLHLHGIRRRALPRKLSGLVECSRATTDHPVLAGMPATWCVPHSRYNGLPEDELVAAGYKILSRAGEAGPDMFSLDDRAPLLLFQGHPEYEAHTLLREYQRDVAEFLSGVREDYPDIPTNYLKQPATALLDSFRARALAERDLRLLPEFPLAACRDSIEARWHDVAAKIWANWLRGLEARRLSHAVGRSPSMVTAAASVQAETADHVLHLA